MTEQNRLVKKNMMVVKKETAIMETKDSWQQTVSNENGSLKLGTILESCTFMRQQADN